MELDKDDPEIWSVVGTLIKENTETIKRLEKIIKDSTEQNGILIATLKKFVRKLDRLQRRIAKLERGFE